jgi:hypothetical protein
MGSDMMFSCGKGVVAEANGAMPSIVAAAPSTVDRRN